MSGMKCDYFRLLRSISRIFPDFPLPELNQEAPHPSPNRQKLPFLENAPPCHVSAGRGAISCLKRGCEIGFFVKRDIFKHRCLPRAPAARMHRLPISEGHGKVQRLPDGTGTQPPSKIVHLFAERLP